MKSKRSTVSLFRRNHSHSPRHYNFYPEIAYTMLNANLLSVCRPNDRTQSFILFRRFRKQEHCQTNHARVRWSRVHAPSVEGQTWRQVWYRERPIRYAAPQQRKQVREKTRSVYFSDLALSQRALPVKRNLDCPLAGVRRNLRELGQRHDRSAALSSLKLRIFQQD